MRTTLYEVAASLTVSATAIVLGVILPYKRARARYRAVLGH